MGVSWVVLPAERRIGQHEFSHWQHYAQKVACCAIFAQLPLQSLSPQRKSARARITKHRLESGTRGSKTSFPHAVKSPRALTRWPARRICAANSGRTSCLRSLGVCPGSPSVSALRPRGLFRIGPFRPDGIIAPPTLSRGGTRTTDGRPAAPCSRIYQSALAASSTG